MGLQQVNKAVLSSASSAITVTGINSDDPYVLILKNIQPEDNTVYPILRFTESGGHAFGVESDGKLGQNEFDALGGDQRTIYDLNEPHGRRVSLDLNV